jgi:hypothetical protein
LAPEDHFARYYLGRVKFEEQRYPAAVDDLERTSELWPSDAEFLLALAAAESSLHCDAGAALAQAGGLNLSGAEKVRYRSLLIANGVDRKQHPERSQSLERG